MHLQNHEEDIKRNLAGGASHNSNTGLEDLKKLAIKSIFFFKFQSISILAILYNKRQFIVSMQQYSLDDGNMAWELLHVLVISYWTRKIENSSGG